jgi:hypothetical protein
VGTYFALINQIHDLADRLEKEGKLEKLFERAHQAGAEEKKKPTVDPKHQQEDK